MIEGLPRTLTITAAVATGLVGGVFFAFSTFVMPALRRLPAPRGIEAMQAVNRAAPASPLFMVALLGTALVCLAVAVPALADPGGAGAIHRAVGSALYLATVVVTAGYHVPRNDALGRLDPAASGAAAAWSDYLAGWTTGNHLRTVTSLAASVAFVLALGAR